jgi:hypothetical protein
LTLATRASADEAAASLAGTIGFGPPALGLFALALTLLLVWTIRGRLSGRIGRRGVTACAVLCLVILIASCGSGGGGNNTYTGTPKGTHEITVQATSGTMTVTTPITLVVK